MSGPRPSKPVPSRSSEDGSGVADQVPGMPELKAMGVPNDPGVEPSNPAVANGEGMPNCVSILIVLAPHTPQAPANQETICPEPPVVKKILMPPVL